MKKYLKIFSSLLISILLSSAVAFGNTEIIRPTGDSSVACARSTGATNYSCVDEAVTDDADYVDGSSGSDAWVLDLYTLANHSTGSGTINSVSVYGRCRENDIPAQDWVKFALSIGGTTYYSTVVNITPSFDQYSRTWNTNPNTTAAWGSDWAVIDDLIAGVSLYDYKDSAWGFCSQLWVVIDYTPAAAGGNVHHKIIIF